MFELLLKILFFPIWFPIIILFSVFLIALSVVVSVSGFAVFIIFAALLLATIILTLVGIFNLFSGVYLSILTFGLGLILFGFSILLLIFGISLCTKLLPKFFAGISSMFRKMFSLKPKQNKYQSKESTKEITIYEEIN
jgi:hypothetical protein